MAKKPKHKGGKGFKSPYETTHIRVAFPIKDQCESLKEMYDKFIENGGDPNNPPDFLNSHETIQKIVACFTELETYLNGNISRCTGNICPNWRGTLIIVSQIKQLLRQFS